MVSRGLPRRVTDTDRERNGILSAGYRIVPRTSGWPDDDHAFDRELRLPGEHLHIGGDRRRHFHGDRDLRPLVKLHLTNVGSSGGAECCVGFPQLTALHDGEIDAGDHPESGTNLECHRQAHASTHRETVSNTATNSTPRRRSGHHQRWNQCGPQTEQPLLTGESSPAHGPRGSAECPIRQVPIGTSGVVDAASK